MSNLSVKAKMTLWYGAFLFIIVAAVAFALVFTTRYIAGKEQKEDLRAAVDSSVSKIHVNSEDLDIKNSLKNYEDGIYLLIYEDGNFLISGVGPEDYPNNIAFRDKKVRNVDCGDSSYYVYDRCLKRKHHVNIWLRGITSSEMAVISPSASTMTKMILIILPVLVLLAIIGGFRMTKRSLRPLGDMAATAHEIGTGKDLSKRMPQKPYSSDKDELSYLVSTFNEMMNRLEKAFLAEKQFSDNASHELRTPVSVILAQCEDAKENAETPEEFRKAIDNIFRQAKNMSSLLTQLLTLARADKGTSQTVMEQIDLSFIADLACEELQLQASAKDIEIRTHIEDGLYCTGDQTMLTMLFMNLISNTISYGKEGGKTDVTLSLAAPDAVWPAEIAETQEAKDATTRGAEHAETQDTKDATTRGAEHAETQDAKDATTWGAEHAEHAETQDAKDATTRGAEHAEHAETQDAKDATTRGAEHAETQDAKDATTRGAEHAEHAETQDAKDATTRGAEHAETQDKEGFWTSASVETPEKPERFLIAEIKDDGIGIAPEHLPKIWDRFYQVDPSRSKDQNAKENNTGLGLPMAMWIVSEHGGIITCESTEGKGSVFTVYLPADPKEKK